MSHRIHAVHRNRGFLSGGRGGPLGARRALGIVAVAAAFLAPVCAYGSGHGGLSFPHAAAPAFNWAQATEMRLSGLPVIVRGFVAALSLEQAAKAMAQHTEHFQRITTLPGVILLSGVHAGRHWVAQIEASQGRVRGLVSALPLDIIPGPGAAGQGVPKPWLTQNARFVFSQSSSARGKTVMQSIHVPHGPLDDFHAALGRRLAESGWRRAGVHTWTTSKVPGGRRIDVFPVRAVRGGDDAVLIHLSD